MWQTSRFMSDETALVSQSNSLLWQTSRLTNRPLYRGYLLKETLARSLDGGQVKVARDKLRDWIAWATRSRLAPFRRVARTIKKHIEGIVAYVATGLSSARSEGINGKIRTITRSSFGFHGPAQPHRTH